MNDVASALDALIPTLPPAVDVDESSAPRRAWSGPKPVAGCPPISLRQFQILANLCSGVERSRTELLKGCCADVEATNLTRITTRMIRIGLIRKRVVPTMRGVRRRDVLLMITPAGISAARQVLAFVASMAGPIKSAAAAEDSCPTLYDGSNLAARMRLRGV